MYRRPDPRDRELTAVEPSATMREQRPSELPAALDATAEALPFEEGSFETSMAIFTVHQWRDLDAVAARFERELGADLRSGRWTPGALRNLPELDGSLRLVIGGSW